MCSVKELANAKVNLYLDVVNKREDGFHDIKTVMHEISLSDEVVVSIRDADKRGVRLYMSGEGILPADERNIAYRAAALFLCKADINASVEISLKKEIPIAAGLAGGSADAAAVLRAMNKLFKKPFSDKYLLALAAELGSDVPFCLVGGTALCGGRGELMTRLSDTLDLNFVVAVASERVSTPDAYMALDVAYADFKGSHSEESSAQLASLLEAVKKSSMPDSELYNIFENVIFKTCNGAEMLKSKMLRLGATHALMSGSGPSVFGVFENEGAARHAREQLVKDGVRAYFAKTV